MPVIYDDKKPIILDYLVCPNCSNRLPQPEPADFLVPLTAAEIEEDRVAAKSEGGTMTIRARRRDVEAYNLFVTTRQGVTCHSSIERNGDVELCGWRGHVIYGRRSLG